MDFGGLVRTRREEFLVDATSAVGETLSQDPDCILHSIAISLSLSLPLSISLLHTHTNILSLSQRYIRDIEETRRMPNRDRARVSGSREWSLQGLMRGW